MRARPASVDDDDDPTGGVAVGSQPEASGRIGRLDVVAAVALVVAALSLRWTFPSDGWFFDDAWQALAARAPLRMLPTVGQTQPGYTAMLMAWSRVTGGSIAGLIVPAMVAGALGPPLLYLWLRRLRFGHGTSALLAAALVISPIHIRFSGRVKVYAVELVVVILIAAVLPRLAARRWDVRTALAWVVCAIALTAFSSFTLLAAAAAGLVLVLHPRGDLRHRVVALGVQGLVVLGTIRRTQATYDAPGVAEQWRSNGAMLTGPVRGLPTRLAERLHHVVAAYVDGPRWLSVAVLVLAVAGLAVTAVRGPNPVSARFLVLGPVLAAAGSTLGRIPFGPPDGDLRRVSLWLFPAVAFGVASSVSALRSPLPSLRARQAWEVALAVSAVAVVVGLGHREPYWDTGAKRASVQVASQLRDHEVVVVTRLTAYSFSLHSGLPVHLRAAPSRLVGFVPVIEDPRVLLPDAGAAAGDLTRVLADADLVTVVNAPVGRDNRDVMFDLAVTLTVGGFQPGETRTVGRTTVATWHRAP